jgi:hypothetical protein
MDARFHARPSNREKCRPPSFSGAKVWPPGCVTAMRPNGFSKRYVRQKRAEDFDMGSLAKGTVLWLLGVPLSVIILIALFTNYI